MAVAHSTLAPTRQPRRGDRTILRALAIIGSRLRDPGECLTSPGLVRAALVLRLADLPHEVFGAFWLDSQNRLIAWEELSRGTLTQTSVFPREVVKRALANNAAGVILAHNHPSGVSEPSRSDELLTRELAQALALIDVRVIDHFIVGGRAAPLSFVERGLL